MFAQLSYSLNSGRDRTLTNRAPSAHLKATNTQPPERRPATVTKWQEATRTFTYSPYVPPSRCTSAAGIRLSGSI